MFGLLKVKGLTFIPLKVMLLFRHILFPFEFVVRKKKEKGKVSLVSTVR